MDRELQRTLQHADVRFVRVLWCDNANVIRAKAIHIGVLEFYLKHGVGISAAQQAVPVMRDAVVPETGLGPVGEIRLVPDWSTLAALPYAPGHVRVLGDMTRDGAPWSLCPRGFLKRVKDAAARAGVQVMGAFENEFYLLKPGPGVEAVEDSLFAATWSMDRNRAVIDDIAEALVNQGVPVELYHPESGPGQHEITMRYANILQAADHQVVFRETVRAVAGAHGLRATFLPKVFPDRAGSGCHLHLSIWRDGQNLLPDSSRRHRISKEAAAFMAGVLHHLPGLMAVTTPSTNSYRRVQPHCWSGAFRCWGMDNREAALRVPSSPEGAGPEHFELKTVDASSNPYLALGSVVAAGLDGITHGLELPEPVHEDPGHVAAEARARRGIDALPLNLGEALAHLGQDRPLLDALGPELAQSYQAVRRAEWEAMQSYELADELAMLLDRY